MIYAANKVKQDCYKTKNCRFFAEGRCTRGDNCTYAHTVTELRDTPDLAKTKICSKWWVGSCKKSSTECSFAHGAFELRNGGDDSVPVAGEPKDTDDVAKVAGATGGRGKGKSVRTKDDSGRRLVSDGPPTADRMAAHQSEEDEPIKANESEVETKFAPSVNAHVHPSYRGDVRDVDPTAYPNPNPNPRIGMPKSIPAVGSGGHTTIPNALPNIQVRTASASGPHYMSRENTSVNASVNHQSHVAWTPLSAAGAGPYNGINTNDPLYDVLSALSDPNSPSSTSPSIHNSVHSSPIDYGFGSTPRRSVNYTDDFEMSELSEFEWLYNRPGFVSGYTTPGVQSMDPDYRVGRGMMFTYNNSPSHTQRSLSEYEEEALSVGHMINEMDMTSGTVPHVEGMNNYDHLRLTPTHNNGVDYYSRSGIAPVDLVSPPAARSPDGHAWADMYPYPRGAEYDYHNHNQQHPSQQYGNYSRY